MSVPTRAVNLFSTSPLFTICDFQSSLAKAVQLLHRPAGLVPYEDDSNVSHALVVLGITNIGHLCAANGDLFGHRRRGRFGRGNGSDSGCIRGGISR
jgi:hypothetical protein